MKLAVSALGIFVSIPILLVMFACKSCPLSIRLLAASIYIMVVLGAAVCTFVALWPWFEAGRVAPGKRQWIFFIIVWLLFVVGLWTVFRPSIDL
jgi:hypothetical protein